MQNVNKEQSGQTRQETVPMDTSSAVASIVVVGDRGRMEWSDGRR